MKHTLFTIITLLIVLQSFAQLSFHAEVGAGVTDNAKFSLYASPVIRLSDFELKLPTTVELKDFLSVGGTLAYRLPFTYRPQHEQEGWQISAGMGHNFFHSDFKASWNVENNWSPIFGIRVSEELRSSVMSGELRYQAHALTLQLIFTF